MVYESRRGDVIVLGASSWRIEDITRDRVIVTPGARRAGADAVLARRQAGPPDRARPRGRRVHADAARLASRRRARAAPSRRGPGRAGGGEPRVLPRGADGGDRRRPRRPDRRRRAVPRRDRRLADVRPLAVRLARARAVGDGDRGAGCSSGSARAPRCSGATTASSFGCPRPSTGSPPRTSCSIPTRSKQAVVAGGAADGDVRQRVPGGGGASAPAPAPPPGPAHAALAAATALGRSARRGVEVPRLPDPAGGHAGVPPRRVRRPGAPRGHGRPPLAAHPARRRSTPSTRRRSRSRCCSDGSASTCTRATRRSPSGARPR